MSGDKPDLLDKIDALLGKRAPDALLERAPDFEDFPVLVDVVDGDGLGELDRRAGERRQTERRAADRREANRRLGDRRQAGRRTTDAHQETPPPPLPAEMNAEMARLVTAMEQRLVDMFIRQQLRMEEAVRKAIREEIGRHRDGESWPG